jgi:hypothetical protein
MATALSVLTVERLLSYIMTPAAVLARTESVANWVGAIGEWVGAIATFAAVVVALLLPRWERQRDMAERRDRDAAQARLVAITVPGRSRYRFVEITNHSEQPVHRPRIESMGDPRLRWGLSDLDTSEYEEVLPPDMTHRVLFDYFNADGTVATHNIEQSIGADDVTITFTDTSGLRWRRTGSSEPVRVIQPAPGTEE